MSSHDKKDSLTGIFSLTNNLTKIVGNILILHKIKEMGEKQIFTHRNKYDHLIDQFTIKNNKKIV